MRVDHSGALELGRRSRGTPRIANRLLRRVRDFAEVGGHQVVNARVADAALDLLGSTASASMTWIAASC